MTSSRCRRRSACWQPERIDFVIRPEVNPTTSSNSGVPLLGACHQLVCAAACIDDRAGVAVVTVQALVATSCCGRIPHNRVVRSISCRDPGRAAAVLTLAPGKHDRRRICRGNFVGPDRTGVIVKTEIRPLAGVISDSGYSSVSA